MQHIPECVRPWYPPHPEKPDYEKMAQQCMDALETYPKSASICWLMLQSTFGFVVKLKSGLNIAGSIAHAYQ